MKYRTPILNKSIVKRKTGSGENENPMNSENADKWKDAISKELQNLYGNNDMKVVESKNIPKGLLKIMRFPQIKGVDYACTYSFTIEMDNEKISVQIPIGDKNINYGKSGLLRKDSLWTQTSWKTVKILRTYCDVDFASSPLIFASNNHHYNLILSFLMKWFNVKFEDKNCVTIPSGLILYNVSTNFNFSRYQLRDNFNNEMREIFSTYSEERTIKNYLRRVSRAFEGEDYNFFQIKSYNLEVRFVFIATTFIFNNNFVGNKMMSMDLFNKICEELTHDQTIVKPKIDYDYYYKNLIRTGFKNL
ncbi:hypothetical protein H8356DRAFT_1373191 [Neocallimastix lanati (nom. inval.)]|nr:hypothetical protein H8356DRAFT_1373191 [Neocallimastix sp. JGI-2020a]